MLIIFKFNDKLFSHESLRRELAFDTRKITLGLVNILDQ